MPLSLNNVKPKEAREPDHKAKHSRRRVVRRESSRLLSIRGGQYEHKLHWTLKAARIQNHILLDNLYKAGSISREFSRISCLRYCSKVVQRHRVKARDEQVRSGHTASGDDPTKLLVDVEVLEEYKSWKAMHPEDKDESENGGGIKLGGREERHVEEGTLEEEAEEESESRDEKGVEAEEEAEDYDSVYDREAPIPIPASSH